MRDSNAETPSRSSPPRSYTLARLRQKPGGKSVLSPGHRRCNRTAGCPATTLRSEHRSGRGNAYRLPGRGLTTRKVRARGLAPQRLGQLERVGLHLVEGELELPA